MIISLEKQFLVFLRVAVLHRFYCIHFTDTTQTLISITIKISIGLNALSLPLWHSKSIDVFLQIQRNVSIHAMYNFMRCKNLINEPRTFKNLVNVVFCCFTCRRCTKYQTCTNCAGFIFMDPDKDLLCT